MIAETDMRDAVLRTQVWGIDLSGTLQRAGGVGGLLKTTEYPESTTATPLFDGNGNIDQYVFGQNGDDIVKFTYDLFGNELSDTADLQGSFPFRFSTKFTDDCVAAKSGCGDCWDEVIEMIQKTKTVDVEVAAQRQWPLGPITETLKKFGDFRVIDSSKNSVPGAFNPCKCLCGDEK